MPASAPDGARPFVETSIARHLLSRFRITHEEKGIAVFSGPWGIGKTTAIDAFHNESDGCCAIVKADPGSNGRGVAPIAMMQHTLEALWRGSRTLSRGLTGYWPLRTAIRDCISQNFDPEDLKNPATFPKFTIIFDEAQYLSAEAIEVLRFWNDGDRTTTPFPVGLIFVGNNEFSLEEDGAGQSVLSGAVRSRALFIEPLSYADITDQDLTLFAQSRGVTDASAIAEVIRYYSGPRMKRDLRNVERILTTLIRRAGVQPVTGPNVRDFLHYT